MNNQPSLWRRPLVLTVITITSLMLWGLIVAVAFAQPVRPPREYLTGPVEITVNFVTPDTATRMCRMLNPELSMRTVACATDMVMVMPNPCLWRGDDYAEIVCHKLTQMAARSLEQGSVQIRVAFAFSGAIADATMALPEPCLWRDANYAQWFCEELGHARGFEHGGG